MISTNQYCLTWEHFEEVNNDKRSAFEKLSRSLFKRTKVHETENLHSNPNHPGVEISPVRDKSGKEMISFQAKYFDNTVDYTKIASSINTAIKHYKGHLDTIYLYCNKDITSTCQGFLKIQKLATAAGMRIVLVTGQSILDEALDFPAVLSCYFGLDSIDTAWFEKNLQISLADLGRRYNSLFNIDTKAEHELGLFLKDDAGVYAINQKKTEAVKILNDLKSRSGIKYVSVVKRLINSIREIEDVSTDNIFESLNWKDSFEQNNAEIFSKLVETESKIKADLEGVMNSNEYEALRNELLLVRKLSSISNILGFSDHEKQLVMGRTVIVSGEMGVGKSQLLASAAQKMISLDRPALLLLGQTYISEEPIDIQIMNGLAGIENEVSFESLLGVMDEKAYLTNGYAAIFIDAINETRYKDVWKTCIHRLLATIEQYDNILLVISHRDKFEQLLFSERVIEDINAGTIPSITHIGFADNSPKSVFEFLSHYGIPASPEYYLQREMNNPLFLSWFCQTYSKEEYGMVSLIANVLEKADEEASKAAGYTESIKMLKQLLKGFAEVSGSGFVSTEALLNLDVWKVYGVSNKIAYIKAIERSGVLVTYVRNGEERYYWGYNMLEEYIQACLVMEKQKSEEMVKDYCLNTLLAVDENGRIQNTWNVSIFAMVTALYAIKYREECFGIIDSISDKYDKQYVVDECIKTLSWRDPRVSLDDFVALINHFEISYETVWSIFIENATKEKSILNSEGLSRILMRYSLSKRDFLWTTYVNELSEYDRIINLAYYFEAGHNFNDPSENKTLLLLTLFAWMLSSSNRGLRDRVSKAMVEIMKRHINLCKELLAIFKDVNDPYIIQRLYGIVFGAIMKCPNLSHEEFGSLASFVYAEVFSKDKVYPDILLRDYARLILERYLYVYPDAKDIIDASNIRPPYKSDPIPVVDVVDYSDEKYHTDGMYRLLFSMKFNTDVKGIGLYGDFGRYIFQSSLSHFKGVDEHNIYYYSLHYIIDELGYSNDFFGWYDTNLADFDRNHVRQVERIGKKYEWITLYNVLARLSDTYMVADWNGEERGFYQGAWELFIRDFDPTLNIRYPVDYSLFPLFKEKEIDENRFIDIGSDEEAIKNWVVDDDEMYSSISERLIRTDKNGTQWVSLYLQQEIRREIPDNKEASFGYPRGEQHIWSIASLHIEDDDFSPTVELLHSSGYVSWNNGMNSLRRISGLYTREYIWSPGFAYESIEEWYDDEERTLKATPAVIDVLWDSQYDASQETTTSYLIPSEKIIRALDLVERDIRGVFFYNDEVAAFDTTILGDEQGELLIRKDFFERFVRDYNAHLFWSVVGEKQFFMGEHNQIWQRREGYYLYDKGSVHGEMRIVPNM